MSYSTDTLEFGRLLDLVAQRCETEMGASLIRASTPFSSRSQLDRSLMCVREAIALREEKQVMFSFGEMPDPSEAISILRIENAALEPTVLLDVARLAIQALFVRSTINAEQASAPTLWEIVASVPASLLAPADEIKRKILPGGEIDDNASPELASLRHEISSQKIRLTRSLETAMRAAGNAIQDEIVTVRNDRFVIPVKSDFRGKVSGVAHGFSSSGQTVYLEPLAAIEANNELQNLRGKEEREVSRILFSLTAALREQISGIEDAAAAVAELDAIGAKIEYAARTASTVAEITDDTLDLTDARHPLLEESLAAAGASSSIVANSFRLDGKTPVMVISGANAGGKTVVLKTAGLLSMMAISGLPVPASAAKVPFYRSILADIGDHQSLSANLSTFSSHMSNIASMIAECKAPSLVLLDEAGTGTDPDEGSALGVAIVDHFRRACGAHVIASTHYRGLKVYAASDDAVINASVEFDERTLEPTYKLLNGLAGASSGIEIARRFGISDDVIADARKNLDAASQEAESYLLKLQSETHQAADLRTALEEEREAVALKYGSLEVDAVKKEKARQKEFEAELAAAVDEFERQSKAFLKTIEDKALRNRLDKERLSRKAEMNRAVIDKIQPKSGSGVKRGRDGSAAECLEPADLKIGARVLTSFGKAGTIERIDDGVAQVLVGNIHLREKLADLRFADVEAAAPRAAAGSGIHKPVDAADVASELNLIGFTTADAEYELDRFLDEAYLASQPRVRIIHGFGTGALKNYVHHFLRASDLVERFEFAPDSQGGHGATIAELKQ